MYLENDIETLFRENLEDWGFLVLKLKTPGRTGCMDRMILRPKYSPGAPLFVELKRSGKDLRPLQAAIADDWKARGVEVLMPAIGREGVVLLVADMIKMVQADYAFAKEQNLQ